MKALSLWQPWASLIYWGYKRIETRSWSTNYRGPLVIHAAKRAEGLYEWCTLSPFKECLAQAGIKSFVDLPLGKALCVVDLVDCVRAETVRHHISTNEHAFGNYDDGRWAWNLDNVRRFTQPLTMRGAQGLFDCSITMPELYYQYDYVQPLTNE